ncbi:MAG: sulfotransferase [bacterium]|nr:sulfotransferase [bacterium]
MSADVRRPAFVIGTGRCGLSPLMDLIAYHPDFGWPSQYHERMPDKAWIGRLSRIVEWPLLRGPLKFRLQPYIPVHDEAWGYWRRAFAGFSEPFRDLTEDDVTPRARHGMKRAVVDILESHAKPRFIAEYSGWSRVRFIREIFPDAIFIHIVRNPRAVVNSLVNINYWRGYEGISKWRWGEPGAELQEALKKYDHSFLALAGVQWKILINSLRETTSELPDDAIKLVRYEDMVADPHATARECIEFLGADASDSRFGRHLGTTSIVDANQVAFRIPSWRESMSPKQIAMLEELLEEELAHFGY